MGAYHNIPTGMKVIVNNHVLRLKCPNDVLDNLNEAIKRAVIDKLDFKVQMIQVNMGRIVGKKLCVETTEKDEIFYAAMPGRKSNRVSRYVRNREPVDSSFITLILQKRDDERFQLFNCYIGEPAPMDLSDPHLEKASKEAQQEALEFWKNHALIYE